VLLQLRTSFTKLELCHKIKKQARVTVKVPLYGAKLVKFVPTMRCYINPLMPNDPYSGRTTPLTSKRCILYIYSTNTGTEYLKHGIYSPFFFSSSKCSLFHNSNIFGSCFSHILYTGCAKI